MPASPKRRPDKDLGRNETVNIFNRKGISPMKKKVTALLIVPLLFLICTNAHAYLDPGTGSMLLQGLIAGIMVVGTTIGIYWKRLKTNGNSPYLYEYL